MELSSDYYIIGDLNSASIAVHQRSNDALMKSDYIDGIKNITGGAGNDTLTGKDDISSVVKGGAGSDTFYMSTGALQGDGSVIGDRIYGDSGDDTFVFKAPDGTAVEQVLEYGKGTQIDGGSDTNLVDYSDFSEKINLRLTDNSWRG